MPKEHNTKKHVQIFIISVVGALLIAAVVALFAIPINVKDIYYLELGNELSTDAKDYVENFRPGNLIAGVDISNVNAGELGTYEAYVQQGFYKQKFEVVVQDTIAPELVFPEEIFILDICEIYKSDYFISEIIDASDDVQIYITSDYHGYSATERKTERIQFASYCGEVKLTFLAVDESGNESYVFLTVYVDLPPDLYVKYYYVTPGSEVNFLNSAECYDVMDGNLTPYIKVEDDGVDLSTIGTYEITYSCEDSLGMTITETCQVNVMDAGDIQELINTHVIDHSTEEIFGAYNKYDNGYFENMSVDEVMEEMRKTIVHIYHSDGWGSGFIIEITDEKIIIVTNQHVVDNKSEVYVFLNTGDKFYTGEVVYTSWDYDIAFITVPITKAMRRQEKDLLYYTMSSPEDGLLNELATVHINKGYWDSIQSGSNINVGITNIDENCNIIHHETGRLISKSTSISPYWDSWRNLKKMITITADSYKGMSGSVIYDQGGNCLGVIWGQYEATGKDGYGIPLDTLCELYEQHFGRKPYYH